MSFAFAYFHIAVAFIAATFFVTSAFSDLRSYRIPNEFCGLLLLLYPIHVLSSPIAVNWETSLLVALIVAALGFIAFWRNVMGAGDVKLLAVASLWAGPQYIATLLAVTAFAGGIEALAFAGLAYARRPKLRAMPPLAKAQIPYGVAIATGGLTTLGFIIHPLLLPE